MSTPSRVVAVVLCVLIAGCAPSAPPGIFLPTYGSMDALPTALLDGLLIEEEGCLWIEADETRYLLLWPDGSHATAADGQLVVYNGGNRAVVGTRVSAGGGEYDAQALPELIGEVVPMACRESGHYWLGGSVKPAAP